MSQDILKLTQKARSLKKMLLHFDLRCSFKGQRFKKKFWWNWPPDVEVHQEERDDVCVVLGGRGQDSHPGNTLVSSFHRALRRSLWGREDVEFITISGGLKIYKIVISLNFNHHLFWATFVMFPSWSSIHYTMQLGTILNCVYFIAKASGLSSKNPWSLSFKMTLWIT